MKQRSDIILYASHSAWEILKSSKAWCKRLWLKWPVVTFLFRYFPTFFNEGPLYHRDLSIRSLYNLNIISTARFWTAPGPSFSLFIFLFHREIHFLRNFSRFARLLSWNDLMRGSYFMPSLFNSRGYIRRAGFHAQTRGCAKSYKR